MCFSKSYSFNLFLNGRSLIPGLFLELASWPKWAIDGEGLWLEWWWRTWWSLYELICGDRRNLQKNKHHCNTPTIWTLTLWETRLSGLMNLNSKHHIWRKADSAHHLQSTIPKVKCAGSSLMLWSCFSVAGTEGLVGVEERLNAPKYWDSLSENTVQSTQNLRLDRSLYFQRDNDPNHTARVAYTKLCECPWVALPRPGIKPSQ